jgi:hypothetical protein
MMTNDEMYAVFLKLEEIADEHSQVYDKDDDHWYKKDEPCDCEFCISYRTIYKIKNPN